MSGLIIMKSTKTPNHPAYHWSTHWPLEVWVRGLYNSWWFCVHKLSMFIYLSMVKTDSQNGHSKRILKIEFALLLNSYTDTMKKFLFNTTLPAQLPCRAGLSL